MVPSSELSCCQPLNWEEPWFQYFWRPTCYLQTVYNNWPIIVILCIQSSTLVPNLPLLEKPFPRSSTTARCLYSTTQIVVCFFFRLGKAKDFLSLCQLILYGKPEMTIMIWQCCFNNFTYFMSGSTQKWNSVNTMKKQVSTGSTGNLKLLFFNRNICKYTRMHDLLLFENTWHIFF